jgi:hypothetical protein
MKRFFSIQKIQSFYKHGASSEKQKYYLNELDFHGFSNFLAFLIAKAILSGYS